MATTLSPCEKICTLEPGSSLCSGCGRSLAEIENWATYSNAERARIMQELPGRLKAIGLRRPTPAPLQR
jgi:predicted Fe-S protein YdhL (DUF1289 family)